MQRNYLRYLTHLLAKNKFVNYLNHRGCEETKLLVGDFSRFACDWLYTLKCFTRIDSFAGRANYSARR